MRTAEAEILELSLEGDLPAARLACPPGLVPAPGRYLLAARPGTDDPLPVPLFAARVTPDGFLAAPPVPADWAPGTRLRLRGPLGGGFNPPPAARRVALAALGETPSRLLALLPAVLGQGAALTLLWERPFGSLPAEVEVQPPAALPEVCAWADYLALDLPRARLAELPDLLGWNLPGALPPAAQVLVETPLPCGGLAECGVCAVEVRRSWKLACKDGPVFDLAELMIS
jgi:hypothetical protein